MRGRLPIGSDHRAAAREFVLPQSCADVGFIPSSTFAEAQMSHEVDFSIPSRDLGRSDVEFNVKKDGRKLGTLKVSKGSVVWFATDTSYGYKLTWSAFDALMQANGKRSEKRQGRPTEYRRFDCRTLPSVA
jgi:hypothetical protein